MTKPRNWPTNYLPKGWTKLHLSSCVRSVYSPRKISLLWLVRAILQFHARTNLPANTHHTGKVDQALWVCEKDSVQRSSPFSIGQSPATYARTHLTAFAFPHAMTHGGSCIEVFVLRLAWLNTWQDLFSHSEQWSEKRHFWPIRTRPSTLQEKLLFGSFSPIFKITCRVIFNEIYATKEHNPLAVVVTISPIRQEWRCVVHAFS